MAKHDYQVELPHLCWNTSHRSTPLRAQQLCCCWIRHVAGSNVWLHLLRTFLPIFVCLVLLMLGHGLLWHLLQHYAASLSLAPTESKIPVKFVLGWQNLSQNMLYYKYHKSKCTNPNSRHYAGLQNCEKRLLASSCLSISPSVCPHGTVLLRLDGLSWNLIFEDFSKTVEKIQFSLRYHKNNRYCTWRATGTAHDKRQVQHVTNDRYCTWRVTGTAHHERQELYMASDRYCTWRATGTAHDEWQELYMMSNRYYT